MEMEFETLKTETRGNILYCWLNRPEKRNAINLKMLEDLLNLYKNLSEDEQVGVLVLRGAGKVFSAGADLSLMSDISGKAKAEILDEAGLFFDCFNTLYRLQIPTICYVHGGVHGGANGLLSACDYTLSDPKTLFSFGEVKLGLVPATVAPFVTRRTGFVHAKRMMLGAYTFGAGEAIVSGLIDQISSENEADKSISALGQQILQNAPGALSATKKLLLDIEDKPDSAGLKEVCTELIAGARLSDEARTGIEAFFEKRIPSWRTNND